MVNINLNGIKRMCSNSLGGIKRVGICNYGGGYIRTNTRIYDTDQYIHGTSLDIKNLGTKEYETLPSGSTYTISSVKGGNSILNYKVSITLNFAGLTDEQYDELRNLLRYNTGYTIFVEMNTGEILCFGYYNPAVITAFNVNSGSDVTANLTNVLQLEVSEPELPRKVAMDWPK